MKRFRQFACALALLVPALAASPAHAIVDGEPAPADSVAGRSTVFVGGGCTGSLVAPTLVLTSGHCVTPPEAGPDLFRGPLEPDWERPDRFYPLEDDVSIAIGTDLTSPTFTTSASEYAMPGRADMLLLRLLNPVPADKADVVPILTRPPSDVTDYTAWVAAQTFRVAGFGDENDDDGWRPSDQLNQGLSRKGVFPCERADAHKLCVESADGSGVRLGDSGGPLLWTSPQGGTFVAGVLKQANLADNSGIYIATFYRGGSNTDRTSLSNIGGWLEQWVSGRPGGTAFLRTTSAWVDHIPESDHTSNPSGLTARVDRLDTGRYDAYFEGLRETPYREPRVALVSALGTDDAYCKLAGRAQSDRVRVACLHPNGLPANSRFSVLTDISDNDVLVRAPRLLAGTTSVPSAHGTVSVSRIAAGEYKVAAPGFRGGDWRNVLTTAESPGRVRCHPRSWSGATAIVRCVSAAGVPADSAFTLAATAGLDSGYAWAHQESRASYLATPRFANVPGTDDKPLIRRLATGRYSVTFTGAPSNIGGNVQVTAAGDTSNYCTVEDWTAVTAYVSCRAPSGTLADTEFLVRYFDPLDTGRRVELSLRALHATSIDECGELDMYGTLRLVRGATGTLAVPLESNADVRIFERPPLGIAVTSEPGARYVEAELRIRDQDGSCGGSSIDDEVDIAARADVTRYTIQIDLQAHTVQVLDADLPVLGGQGLWWTDGRDGRETGKAELAVEIVGPTGLY